LRAKKNRVKATIKDVASIAGVSIKTVSRVTNNEPNVKPSTKNKVIEAIKQLKYTPNHSARRLRARRSGILALFYENPLSGSYVLDVQAGALNTCQTHAYDLLIHRCDTDDLRFEDEIMSLLENKNIDGVILTPPLSDNTQLLNMFLEFNLKVARIAPAFDNQQAIDVRTNDREAAASMVTDLISLGHKKIGFIIGKSSHKVIQYRHLGYKDALKKGNIKVNNDLIAQGSNSFKSGYEAAAQIMTSGTIPTAIFASTDDMAAGVIKYLYSKGIRVPQDISVAGFDNIPLANQLSPSLTTIHQPIQAMSAMATEQLIASLDDDAICEKTIESHLVRRESTGPVRKNKTTSN